MVIFLLLGIADLVTAGLMLLMHLNVLHEWRLVIIGAVYLVGKGVMLRGSLLSILDILAGVYIVLLMLGLRTILVYVFILVLGYKFLVSLIMRGRA